MTRNRTASNIRVETRKKHACDHCRITRRRCMVSEETQVRAIIHDNSKRDAESEFACSSCLETGRVCSYGDPNVVEGQPRTYGRIGSLADRLQDAEEMLYNKPDFWAIASHANLQQATLTRDAFAAANLRDLPFAEDTEDTRKKLAQSVKKLRQTAHAVPGAHEPLEQLDTNSVSISFRSTALLLGGAEAMVRVAKPPPLITPTHWSATPRWGTRTKAPSCVNPEQLSKATPIKRSDTSKWLDRISADMTFATLSREARRGEAYTSGARAAGPPMLRSYARVLQEESGALVGHPQTPSPVLETPQYMPEMFSDSSQKTPDTSPSPSVVTRKRSVEFDALPPRDGKRPKNMQSISHYMDIWGNAAKAANITNDLANTDMSDTAMSNLFTSYDIPDRSAVFLDKFDSSQSYAAALCNPEIYADVLKTPQIHSNFFDATQAFPDVLGDLTFPGVLENADGQSIVYATPSAQSLYVDPLHTLNLSSSNVYSTTLPEPSSSIWLSS